MVGATCAIVVFFVDVAAGDSDEDVEEEDEEDMAFRVYGRYCGPGYAYIESFCIFIYK